MQTKFIQIKILPSGRPRRSPGEKCININEWQVILSADRHPILKKVYSENCQPEGPEGICNSDTRKIITIN